jgi:hypothetical protein
MQSEKKRKFVFSSFWLIYHNKKTSNTNTFKTLKNKQKNWLKKKEEEYECVFLLTIIEEKLIIRKDDYEMCLYFSKGQFTLSCPSSIITNKTKSDNVNCAREKERFLIDQQIPSDSTKKEKHITELIVHYHHEYYVSRTKQKRYFLVGIIFYSKEVPVHNMPFNCTSMLSLLVLLLMIHVSIRY